MAVADRIYQNVQKLPERLQSEVLDFVEYLLLKVERETWPEEKSTWSNLSLALAMRDMVQEDTPDYTTDDLKTVFQKVNPTP
jgi:hypothetical protein